MSNKIYACVIESPTRYDVPLDNGSTAAFVSLDDPLFIKWKPVFSVATFDATFGLDNRLHVQDQILNTEIHTLVSEFWGHCMWGVSTEKVKAIRPNKRTVLSRFLWAWNKSGLLVCIAAPMK